MSYGDDHDDARERGISSQTRTRLPDDPDSAPHQPLASARRSLMTVVGVVVLLIAAIVFANRADDRDSGGDAGETPDGSQAQPTAPTGEQPVDGSVRGIPSGFAQTEQGAQSAAANYAVALGGTEMFDRQSRHSIVDTLYRSDVAAELKPAQDGAYSEEFLARLDLDVQGNPPTGMTFVSRAIPVGTTVVEFDTATATVKVWYTGLIGMAGENSTDPVRTNWKTWSFELEWVNDDWKIVRDSQVDGPAPVPGDIRASGSDEIAEAVEQYGGFTYAR